MARDRFRFRPPPVTTDEALRSALGVAFELASDQPIARSRRIGPREIDLLTRLGLLSRAASRSDAGALGFRHDDESLATLRRARAMDAAREMRLDDTLARVLQVAASLGIELAVLKGRALVLGGYSRPGSRPSGDVDLLLPGRALDPLRAALRADGFEESPATAEHHAPMLGWPGGSCVELHRFLPGVRLRSRASARWEELASAGLLEPLPGGHELAGLQVPARPVLAAHALVHVLSQHAFHPTSYPGWLLIGDLIDLGVARRTSPPLGADTSWSAWIARDVSRAEIQAALDLASDLASGGNPLLSRPDGQPALLARHFTACALDSGYAQALKSRQLEAPLSERPWALALLVIVARAFVPPVDGSSAGRSGRRMRRAIAWFRRPFVLAGKGARALFARARLARRAEDSGG